MGLTLSYFQVTHMIFEGTQGVSVSLFATVIIFIGANILLALQSNKHHPSPRMNRVIKIYGIWLIVHIILLIETIVLRIYHYEPIMYNLDTTTFILVAMGYLGIFLWAIKKIYYQDPSIKGMIGLTSKSLPQIVLMIMIFSNGDSGHSAMAIFLPIITPLMRIAQIWLNPNHDRNRYWLLISEWSNEITWFIVTIS